jgi:hypothetical protein
VTPELSSRNTTAQRCSRRGAMTHPPNQARPCCLVRSRAALDFRSKSARRADCIFQERRGGHGIDETNPGGAKEESSGSHRFARALERRPTRGRGAPGGDGTTTRSPRCSDSPARKKGAVG